MNIGDVVQLKSGGPKMTVQTVNEVSVQCQWFGEGDVLGIGDFLLDAIKTVKAEAPKTPKKAK